MDNRGPGADNWADNWADILVDIWENKEKDMNEKKICLFKRKNMRIMKSCIFLKKRR